MFKEYFIKQHQKRIDRNVPSVNIKLNREIPLPSAAEIARLSSLVSAVNAKEKEVKDKPQDFFRQQTAKFRQMISAQTKTLSSPQEIRHKEEEILNQILPLAFALVREAARRTIGLRHFDVQILGGVVLHRGGIAEMATGEGKTLVATLPAYLNALTGRGVHIVTVNDYLAKRDSEWMGPIYEFLGLSVGVIQNLMPSFQRKKEYACDIVYGTNNEFGFDYLRDNMVIDISDMVQRGHFYAIVDEVDSILIDEARTPLIISGPAEESTDKYYQAEKVVRKLKGRKILERDEVEAKYKEVDLGAGFDYLADEKNHTVTLTEAGLKKCEQLLGVKDLYEDIQAEWPHHIIQAIKAKEFFHRDKDYIVKEGKVIIVDEFTGRLMPGRRWSDGLHQAVEAKEHLKIQEESQTLATITLQNYFKMYEKLSGMTGTAYTEAQEFKHIYNMDVVVIPTNRPLRRTNHPDKIYKTKKAKFMAVVKEIEELHKIGRPLLVGTTSIENSELLSSLLKQKGIPHQVLNAKYHEREAYIVAQAGRLGQVTIATNMAGRGTDIVLGGNLDYLVKSLLRQKKFEDEESYQQEYRRILAQYKEKIKQEQEKVVELGGLHVIGTERHEARRIDNQLRGRAGRQGDPGSSCFYISLEDDLMRLFGSERIAFLMDRFGFPEDEPIEHALISRQIEVAQRRVEAQNFEIRKQLLEYDNVMNKQREVIYTKRKEILEGKELKEDILVLISESLEENLDLYFSSPSPETQDNLLYWLKYTFGISLTTDYLQKKEKEELYEDIYQLILNKYKEKETRIGSEQMRFLERMIYLQIIDSRWKDHLLVMDNLKEGITLRAYGQRNPIDEYKHESYLAFLDTLHSVREGVIDFIFKAELQSAPSLPRETDFSSQKLVHEDFSALAKTSNPVSSVRRGRKIGRNEPCPCGSGKKYKHCCGRRTKNT